MTDSSHSDSDRGSSSSPCCFELPFAFNLLQCCLPNSANQREKSFKGSDDYDDLVLTETADSLETSYNNEHEEAAPAGTDSGTTSCGGPSVGIVPDILSVADYSATTTTSGNTGSGQQLKGGLDLNHHLTSASQDSHELLFHDAQSEEEDETKNSIKGSSSNSKTAKALTPFTLVTAATQLTHEMWSAVVAVIYLNFLAKLWNAGSTKQQPQHSKHQQPPQQSQNQEPVQPKVPTVTAVAPAADQDEDVRGKGSLPPSRHITALQGK